MKRESGIMDIEVKRWGDLLPDLSLQEPCGENEDNGIISEIDKHKGQNYD